VRTGLSRGSIGGGEKLTPLKLGFGAAARSLPLSKNKKQRMRKLFSTSLWRFKLRGLRFRNALLQLINRAIAKLSLASGWIGGQHLIEGNDKGISQTQHGWR